MLLTPVAAAGAAAEDSAPRYFAGNDVEDAYGGAGLAWQGPPGYSAGRSGKAGDRAFAVGSTRALSLTDADVGNFGTQDFTVHLFGRFSLGGAPSQQILSKRVQCAGNTFLDLHAGTRSGGVVHAELQDDQNFGFGVTAPVDVLDNAWHEITLTRANTTLRLTVDGIVATGNTVGVIDLVNTAPLRLGDGPCVGINDSTRVNGLLDEVSLGPGTKVIGPPPAKQAKSSARAPAPQPTSARSPEPTIRPAPAPSPTSAGASRSPAARAAPTARVASSVLAAEGTALGAPGSPDPPGGAATAYSRELPNPSQISTDPAVIARSALLAVALLALLALPIGIVNDTATANAGRIGAFVTRWRGVRFPVLLPRQGTHPLAVLITIRVVVGALLFTLLEPSVGADRGTLAVVIGQAVAVACIAVASKGAALVYLRRGFGATAALRLYPLYFVIAVVCVLFSRLTGLHPGLVLGTVVGVGAAAKLPAEAKGRSVALGTAALGGAGMLAWLFRGPVVDAAGGVDAFVGGVCNVTLTTVAVAASETLVFGMLPMAFLDGQDVFAWSRPAWAGLSLAGAFGFVHVVLQPGDPGEFAGRSVYLGVLLAVYLAAAAAFWGWFRWRPSRVPAQRVTSWTGAAPDRRTPDRPC